jgi:HlyD family secretion protein
MVDVGSELSGIVDTLHVDENDSVKKGQVLARLDLARLKDAVTKSRANLASADAQVLQAAATVAETRAKLDRMRRVAELSGGKVPSRSEMDGAEADHKRAMANETSARAAVAQARATLQSDDTNLGKAHIRSPIDGVVLARKIQVGQTVAASFQAPVLFTLAEDLAKMELQVNVDEADVGQVEVGQKAVFSVDAWPGRAYTAVITRVGYGSQVSDGVVSYLTILEVDNADLSLRPGMTGNAEITTLDARGRPAGAQCRAALHAGGDAGGTGEIRRQRDEHADAAPVADDAPGTRPGWHPVTSGCGCCATARRCRWTCAPAPPTVA